MHFTDPAELTINLAITEKYPLSSYFVIIETLCF